MATLAPWPGARRVCTLSSPGERRPGGSQAEVPGAQAGGGRRPGLPTAESVQHAVHVVLLAQALEEGDEVQQFRVRHVVEPGLHRHLEDSACSGQPA